MNTDKKFYFTASLKPTEATEELKQEVASVIDLPKGKDKQPDLSYFSGIMVSSGENLNHAYFLGSELVSAFGSVVSKAVDVEHAEQEVIGHIFSSAYTDKDHNELNITELAGTETAALDSKDMHVQIGCIVYKSRFPKLAKEIADDEWKLSMECFYEDFDVKIGDTILSRTMVEALGLETSDESIYGKEGVVMRAGKEVARGEVARVLRGICFSGVGIVKNPANPPSVIIETSSNKEDEGIVLNLDEEEVSDINEENSSNINVTSKDIEGVIYTDSSNDELGVCVNYKKRVEDKDGNITNENWCSEFSTGCTSFSRDVSDQDCLKNQVKKTAAMHIEALFEERRRKLIIKDNLGRLENALNKAKSSMNNK